MPITAQQFERTYNAIQTGNAVVEKRRDGKDWITITIETSQETAFDWLIAQGMAFLGAGKYASPLSIFLSIMSPKEMGMAILPKDDFMLKPQEKIVMRGDVLIKRLFPVPPKLSSKPVSNTSLVIADLLKKHAAQKQTNDLQVHHKKGLEFIKKNEFENAILQFNQALTLSANYQPALVQRGICYLHLKNYSKSILDLEKAKQLEKTNYGVYYHLSLAYFRSNQLQKASENISQALRILPGNSTYLSVQKQINDAANVSHKPKPNNARHSISNINKPSKNSKPVLTKEQEAVKKSLKREQAAEICKRVCERNTQKRREENDRKRQEHARQRPYKDHRRREEESEKRREENLKKSSEQQRRTQQLVYRPQEAQKPIKTFLISYLKYQERHGNPLNGQGLLSSRSRACAQTWNDVAKGKPICVSKS